MTREANGTAHHCRENRDTETAFVDYIFRQHKKTPQLKKSHVNNLEVLPVGADHTSFAYLISHFEVCSSAPMYNRMCVHTSSTYTVWDHTFHLFTSSTPLLLLFPSGLVTAFPTLPALTDLCLFQTPLPVVARLSIVV